jgi:thiol-disulfide isomerase/thioredoxin
MRPSVPIAVFAVALVAVAAGVRYFGNRPPASPATPSVRLAQPRALESFSVRDLDGREVATAAWSGKVVVVNFWATWCLPCRREIPELVALQNRHRDRLVVVGIIDDKAPDSTVREFMSSLGVNYPVVRSTFELAQRFPSVEVLPMTVVVDRQTRIASVRAGELVVTELEKEIVALMDGR